MRAIGEHAQRLYDELAAEGLHPDLDREWRESQRMAPTDGLGPSRGIMLGFALATVFWLAVASMVMVLAT